MISFKNVSKIYPCDIVALNKINLEIDKKEFVFITGPSGAGKSTIVRLLVREEKPTSGDIVFQDIDVTNLSPKLLPVYRQQIGVAFQDLKLLESRTARENIEFALEIINKTDKEILNTAEYLLDLVSLKDRANLLPYQLSGGEKQKIAIARALASEPKLLIADEPTGNLDANSTQEIMEILKTVNSIGTTILVITHNTSVVEKMSQRVVTLEKGEIISDDKPKGKKETEKKKDEKKEKEESKKKVTKEKKEEKIVNISDLNLEEDLEKKLLENNIKNTDELLDLTKSKVLKMGITEKELDIITNAIVELTKSKK